MPCVLCPEGTCPPNCPLLEVFPVEAPFKTRQELMDTGFKLEFIRECLLKENYTPDEQKRIVEGMIKSWEYIEVLAKKHRLMEELHELTEKENAKPLKEAAAAGKGVPGLTPKDD